MKEKASQNIELQVLRALAIVLVLFRHAIAQVDSTSILWGVEQIIICLHMPAFFLISGYLFQKNLPKYQKMGKIKFLKKKAIYLLVPYVFWFFFLWFGVTIFCSLGPSFKNFMISIGFEPMSLFKAIYGIVTFEVFYMEHLWFLYVLFFLFFINIFLEKLGSSKIMLVVSFFLGLTISVVSISNIIDRLFLWGLYFFFGRFLQKSIQVQALVLNVNTSKLMLLILSFLFCCFLRIGSLQNLLINNPILNQFVKYIIGFLGVWLLYLLSRKITTSKIKEVFRIIGDYSYEIYLMHNPYCVALSAILLNKILGITSYITIFVAVILGIILPIFAAKFIKHSKILSLVMLGKN